jgi:hypothetical protein
LQEAEDLRILYANPNQVIAPGTILIAVDFLHSLDPWVLGGIFFALFMASSECGFRLGQRSPLGGREDTGGRIMAVAAGVMGVLGLLLAFTLAMAVSRFDARRLLLVDEANAIGTAYLRTQVVPPPDGPELARLLRDYVDARIHFFDPGADLERLRAAREHTATLQGELWSLAAANAQKDPRSVPAGLLLQSLNQTFDLEASRWTALTVYIPDNVIYTDILVGTLTLLLVGYNFGVTGLRQRPSMWLLAVCIATVLTVIVDLDEPRGLIRVGQQPLIDLQRQLGKNR